MSIKVLKQNLELTLEVEIEGSLFEASYKDNVITDVILKNLNLGSTLTEKQLRDLVVLFKEAKSQLTAKANEINEALAKL